MVIRVDTKSAARGYALEVACDGHFRFRNLRQGKWPHELIDWTYNEDINTGEGATNRLGLWAYQGRFVLFINGVKWANSSTGTIINTYGTFALYVERDRTFDLTATFDDFAFWHIPFIP